MQYVGFWWRVLAALIDSVIMSLIFIPIFLVAGVSMFAGGMAGMEGASETDMAAAGAGIGMGMNLLGILLYVGYEALFTSSKMMATPGKRMLGFAVVNAAGARIGLGRAIGRTFGKYLSSLILCIGYIMVAFTGKKQGLHDMIASTFVVRRESVNIAVAPAASADISQQV